MTEYDAHYIDGMWRPGTGESFTLHDPRSGLVAGSVRLATAAEVTSAVDAAVRARDSWGLTGVGERAELLRAVADGLANRRDELIDAVVREVGTPRRLAEVMQVDAAIAAFRDVADLLPEALAPERVGNSVVERVPLGVAGLITPWNYPLYQAALKVAPAMGAGCTVVLKPSELAPSTTVVLADVVDGLGVPAGVFNLVHGDGAVAGEALVGDERLDVVSFTGSGRAGRRVAELAGSRLTKVALELGGKGASVVLPGGDLAAAAKHAAVSCFGNAGQTCAAMTRVIVVRDELAALERAVLTAAEPFIAGDPMVEGTRLGPLVSARQRAAVQSYIDHGIDEGARVLLGSAPVPRDGYYVPATVFTDVDAEMAIAREEIFGPVLVLQSVADVEEALALANSTEYGLTATVWAATDEEAIAFARRLRVGGVTVNGGAFNPSAPFGGRGASGFGRERGRYGVEEFTTHQAFHLPLGEEAA